MRSIPFCTVILGGAGYHVRAWWLVLSYTPESSVDNVQRPDGHTPLMTEQKFLSVFGMCAQMQCLPFLQGYNITAGVLLVVPVKPLNL